MLCSPPPPHTPPHPPPPHTPNPTPPHTNAGEAEFRKHLPAHLRRPPRGPAGPAERQVALGAAAAAAGAGGEVPPLGPPPPFGGPDGDISGANLVPLGVRQVRHWLWLPTSRAGAGRGCPIGYNVCV
jgi:hypothetical protein